MSLRPLTLCTLASASLLLAPLACDKSGDEASVAPEAGEEATEETSDEDAGDAAASFTVGDIDSILASDHRTEQAARDGARHPKETLDFFGVSSGSKVAELWPGGGWYTNILAPLVRDEGELTVTAFDPEGPDAYYGVRQAKGLLDLQSEKPELFGQIKLATIDADIELGEDGKVSNIDIKGVELAPEGSLDVVLTFRNSHGWFRNGQQELIYGAAFKALKPGGVFGVVQHRANDDEDPKEAVKRGRLPESTVIKAAEAVGFKLAEKSDINANDKDEKNYKEGVWTLPPTLTLKDEDKAKYEAIGESDRMTLKFVKPE